MPSPGLCSLRSEGKNPRSASRSRPAGREIPRSAALSVRHFFPKIFKVQKVITPENLRSASRSRPAGREIPRSAALSVGGHFFQKIFKVQKKKKKSYLHITTVRKLSSRPTFLSHRQDEVRVRPRPGFFFFFFFDRAIFRRKTCTGVSSTLCENFGPIRPRVVAQSRKDRLPAPLLAIFPLFWPLSDEEKTFSPSSGNFRQRGTEISSISPGFLTRLVDPKKKEPTS